MSSLEHAPSSARTGDERGAIRHARAWLLLTVALAVHVADEAATDFLGFYNPLVLEIRSRLPWFPMPTFTFGIWLAGLIALLIVLAALTPAVRRGARGTVAASWVLSVIMCLNGVGHLAGSIYFARWLPGSTSAPLLLVASVLLARTTLRRQGSRSLHTQRGASAPRPRMVSARGSRS